MEMIRLTAVAIGLAAMCAATLTAQTQETPPTTKAKIEIKVGKYVTVTGCVEQRTNGHYVLTPVPDTGQLPLEHSWDALVTSQDLSKHVGERVEIRGKAVTNSVDKVAVESKAKTDVEHGTQIKNRRRGPKARAARSPASSRCAFAETPLSRN